MDFWKKKGILLLLLLSSEPIPAQQARLSLGLSSGLTKCQLLGDGYQGYNKWGYAGGAFLKFRLGDDRYMAFEINYTTKGCVYNKRKQSYPYEVRLNYISIPMLVQWQWKKFIAPEIGLSVDYLLRQAEYLPGFTAFYNEVYPFHQLDKCVIVGVCFLLNPKMTIDLRYTNSLLLARNHRGNIRVHLQ